MNKQLAANLKAGVELVGAIVVCELAGIVGSIFTVQAISGWYTTLQRPELAPPNWVFGPVWTTLFALMGIAVWLVWRQRNKFDVRPAVAIFAGQLVLNVSWSLAFFGLESPFAALVTIVVLWLAIVATIIAFARVSKPAAALLIPYLLWVSFASYLNWAFWVLNS